MTEILYWRCKICPESSQKCCLVDRVVTLFHLLFTNDRQKTKGHEGQMRNESLRKQSKLVEYISSLAEAFEFCWSSFEDEHNTLLKSTRRNVKFNKCACGTPWLPDILCKHWFTSSIWNFWRWVVDVPQRETSPAVKSEEKQLFSQATKLPVLS